ncbi:MAG: hypothetical protein CL905_03440 [Dehalococcoidia bacterium]|nr:hypothetical protein [Dehalococcoidia bacterium]
MRKLYLIEDIDKNRIEELEQDDSDLVTLDYISHIRLNENGIVHKTMDEYLNAKDRKIVFEHCSEYLKKLEEYKNEKSSFHGINLIGIIDRNELLEFLMDRIPRVIAISKILEDSKYETVFLSSDLYEIFQNTDYDSKFQIFNTIDKKELTFENITIPIKIGKTTSSINVSRKNYQFIKKTIEGIIGKSFHLTNNNSDVKKIILVEFDPELYFELLQEINKNNLQAILVNFRKSAVYSKKTLQNLRKTNSVFITGKEYLDKSKLEEIKDRKNIILDYLKKNDNKELIPKLSLNYKIDTTILLKRKIINIIIQRIDEYLNCISIAEEINSSKNNLGVLMLNNSGETEKIFDSVFNNRLIFLLQHAFANYTKNISYIDLLDDYHHTKKQFIVWGNFVKNYLTNIKNIDKDQIIVAGSPKYDSFESINKKNSKNKKIIITLRPIIFHVEGFKTELYKNYEKALSKIISSCRDFSNVEIIFKLHPQQNVNNEFLEKTIRTNFPEARIEQTIPIKELFYESDLHINIASDNFDISSVVLEAMILKKPTLNIQLQTNKFNFEIFQMNAIRTMMYDEDIKKEINALLYDKKIIGQLLSNSKQYLKEYLSNHGKASESVINQIMKRNSSINF